MCIDNKEVANYKSLNRLARKNSVVIIGSTYAKEMPVGELKQAFGIISDIYNRSLTDLSVFEAESIVTGIMKDLLPKKIVLQLGETDLEDGTHTIEEVIDEITKIITKCKKLNKTIKVVNVSINNLSDKTIESEFNTELEKLSKKMHCTYADISTSTEEDPTHIQSFRRLKYFMVDDIAFQIM